MTPELKLYKLLLTNKNVYEDCICEEIGWIPVKERLPEEPGRYNVTFRSDGSVHEIGYGSCRADVFRSQIGYGWYDLYSATYFSDDAILAWRPLPKAYKPERG